MNRRSIGLKAGVVLLVLGGGVWIGRTSGRAPTSDPPLSDQQAWQLMLNDGSVSVSSPEAPGRQHLSDRDETVTKPDEPDVAFFPAVVAQSSARVPVQTMGVEERAIWDKELSNLTPQSAHEILTLRTQLGSVAAMSLGLTEFDSASPAPAVLTLPNDGSLKPARLSATDGSSASKIQWAAASVPATPLQNLLSELANVTRHNSANLATPGFKRTEIVIVAANEPRPSGREESPTASLSADLRCVRRIDVRQGEIVETGNTFDVAIDGPGWFVVATTNGSEELTRAGLLAVTVDGKLAITSAGGRLTLKPEVTLPKAATSLLIDADGTCRVWLPEQSQPVVCGSIKLATCLNPSQLSRGCEGQLVVSEQSGATGSGSPGQRGLGVLRQGSLERSNAREEDDVRMLRAIGSMSGLGPATTGTENSVRSDD